MKLLISFHIRYYESAKLPCLGSIWIFVARYMNRKKERQNKIQVEITDIAHGNVIYILAF